MVFASAAILLAGVSSVAAIPWDATAKHATHRVRDLEHGVRVTAYQPASVYETFGEGVDHPLSKRDVAATPKEAALSFLESRLGVDAESLSYRTGYSGEAAHHVYIQQKINGIPVSNSVANVALSKDDKVVAYGSSFVKAKTVASATPKLTSGEAIAKAEAYLNAKWNSFPTSLEYLTLDSDHVVLTHLVQVQSEDHWFQASVDAHTGEVHNVVDFVADATYRVVPFNTQDPSTGFSTVTDPFDTTASPRGWHATSATSYTVTRGNNVNAYKSSSSTGQAPQSSATNNYAYVFNSAVGPTVAPNINAAITNAFYVGNSVHDLTYKYGFTEAAYNFQATNNAGVTGGKAADAVNLSVQDSSGTNNANFATPPDGQAGTCRMFTWTITSPNRDGALENDIVVHEFTHGVTNRLTGGGTGTCLQTTEAGGMGEGWSDFVAAWTEQNSATVGSFTMGTYVYKQNIRSYPYSLSATVNPLRYSTLATRSEVHDIGEVWANILYNVYGALVAQDGFSADKFNAAGTAGNIKMFHLFIDGLALQPCNPTFRSARDAIIQADANRYGGANKCLLWKAFASRGLGYGATASRVDSTTLPSGC